MLVKESKRQIKQPRKRAGKIDMVLFVILFALIVMGLVMLFSASTPYSFYEKKDKFYMIKRQIVWAALGGVCMAFFANFSYKRLKALAPLFLVICLGLNLIVPIAGIVGGGARRWLRIGFITFQPSELAKFALIFYYAKYISDIKRDRIKNFGKGLLPMLLVLGIFIGGFMLQSHLSAAVIVTLMSFTIMLAGGAKLLHFVVMGGAGLAVLVPVALRGFRMDRIVAFLSPEKYKQGIGWQILQSLYAIGSGGLFGLGIGNSRQKFLYLPEGHNDYIFSIICEELGFLGAALVIVLFAALIWRGITISLRAPDMFGGMTAFGITALIGLQVVINIGVVTSLMPSTGMQLPFFSSGGTSLLLFMAAAGVLLNISRHVNYPIKAAAGD